LSGVQSGIKLIKEFQPDLVIGFGSFHSFPLLAAAVYKKVPYMLFEPNAIPGKVNRLFSRWAEATAVQFSHAGAGLKGEMVEVAMPLVRTPVDRKSAHAYFGLNPELPTACLRGSQGAAAINRVFARQQRS
jgi:UDP-N-acetylglucosamine--N-acetylmuramyl-(pentapeptide) pyrophosphoryl-undecaprenol N-acetylglucosamine transferase